MIEIVWIYCSVSDKLEAGWVQVSEKRNKLRRPEEPKLSECTRWPKRIVPWWPRRSILGWPKRIFWNTFQLREKPISAQGSEQWLEQKWDSHEKWSQRCWRWARTPNTLSVNNVNMDQVDCEPVFGTWACEPGFGPHSELSQANLWRPDLQFGWDWWRLGETP